MAVHYKVWYSVIDDRTTVICANAAGLRVLQGDVFDTMVGPLDGPPAHFGCRSILDYWTEGMTPPTELRERAIRELARRFELDPEAFEKLVARQAKLRPPGVKPRKTPVRKLIRTTRQQRPFRERIKRLKATLDDHLKNGRDTESIHRNPLTGRWDKVSKDRIRLHDSWLRNADSVRDRSGRIITKGVDIPREKKAIIVTGLPGSGKSTGLKRLGLNLDRWLAPNSDEFKELMLKSGKLPRWKGLKGLESAALMHEESSYLAKRLTARALKRGTNMVLETTANAASLAKRVEILREAGYTVNIVHMEVPIHTTVTRALSRADRTGRYVPVDWIESLFHPVWGSKQRAAMEAVRDSVDGWVMFDNSVTTVEIARSGSWRGFGVTGS